jgi:hypothetical protein
MNEMKTNVNVCKIVAYEVDADLTAEGATPIEIPAAEEASLCVVSSTATGRS